ncbi:hypothetical protein ACHWQZ_G016112 [Mnemiopsis leidyi]
MTNHKKKYDGKSVGFITYMKKFDRERDHLSKLEKQRSLIEQEAEWEKLLAEDETVGYRSYMKKLEKKNKKNTKVQDKIQSILEDALKKEEEHKRRHSNFANPEHQHTPRGNYRGALEDGEEEKRVICPKEYRRVVGVISDILSDAIEMVQVVFNNDEMTFGNRLHRYVDHSLTDYLERLTYIKTFNNKDLETYKQYAIYQLQYTINQINTMFWRLQMRAEPPKKFKVAKDLLNKWGDTKYSKEKYNDRQKLGLPVPAPRPFEYFIPGEGFISPYKRNKNTLKHGNFYENELEKFTHPKKDELDINKYGGLRPLDVALRGSGEYFKQNPYIGHDHWTTLDQLVHEAGPQEKLKYP